MTGDSESLYYENIMTLTSDILITNVMQKFDLEVDVTDVKAEVAPIFLTRKKSCLLYFRKLVFLRQRLF